MQFSKQQSAVRSIHLASEFIVGKSNGGMEYLLS